MVLIQLELNLNLYPIRYPNHPGQKLNQLIVARQVADRLRD
jgi:hypothetical protein